MSDSSPTRAFDTDDAHWNGAQPAISGWLADLPGANRYSRRV